MSTVTLENWKLDMADWLARVQAAEVVTVMRHERPAAEIRPAA